MHVFSIKYALTCARCMYAYIYVYIYVCMHVFSMLCLYVICTVKFLTKPALAKGCQGERNRCDSKGNQ